MDKKIQALFFGRDRLVTQAEGCFQTLLIYIADRCRLTGASEEKKAAMIESVHKLAEEFIADPPPGNLNGSPSSPAIGESSPVKADAPKNAAVGGKI
jgi:hypothetical protein